MMVDNDNNYEIIVHAIPEQEILRGNFDSEI